MHYNHGGSSFFRQQQLLHEVSLVDKRTQRTLSKRDSIKRTAMEMFAVHGVDKVSVDEIAAKANVSKVTIYKYFGSKDKLYAEVVNMFIDETLAATEEVFNSDLDFLEKLKFALLIKANTSPLVSWDYLLQVWEKEGQLTEHMQQSLQNKVKVLMSKIFEEGKSKGFIEESLSFDLFYLYSEIFRAGIRAKSIDLESVLIDKAAVEKLVDLHFFGLIKRA
jgi:AcrR family transcriptional regulator